LEALARQAGEILRGGFSTRPGFGGQIQVDYKGEIDLVTEMDHRSEEFLLGEIRRSFPGHGIISEESGELGGSKSPGGQDCCLWYVDPLDGTINYAHGVPIFTVSIAYAEDGVMRLGVVYDPMQDECFSAERGKGAWLNGEPIRAGARRTLDECLLVTGFPYDVRTNPENNLDHYANFALRSQGVRRLGSAAMDACYVAAGRLDGYWEVRISPWDVAAGGLIASEAGASVTDVHGQPDYLTTPSSILAANPAIHALMLDVLEKQAR
jgi:myo-inositol-1(or 4)-monophosphatase